MHIRIQPFQCKLMEQSPLLNKFPELRSLPLTATFCRKYERSES